MRFKNIVGHKLVIEKFLNDYKMNRISHAYLIYGTPGIGKLQLALAMGQYLSCSNKSETDSCGVCPSCKKYERLIHPDLHFAFPVTERSSDAFLNYWREFFLDNPFFSYSSWINYLQEKTGKEAQGLIRVEEATNIINKLSSKPYESDYKIMIIWLPELMNEETPNKLLKILEEPPEKTIFFLVSNNRGKIISTIVSRSQPLKILGIETDILKDYIITKHNISDELADNIIATCNGSVIEAEEMLLDLDTNTLYKEKFYEQMSIVQEKNFIKALTWVDEISKLSKEEQKAFILFSLNYFRKLFISSIKSSIVFINEKEKYEITKNIKVKIGSNIILINKLLNDNYYYIERSGNAKIIFFDITVQLMKILNKE